MDNLQKELEINSEHLTKYTDLLEEHKERASRGDSISQAGINALTSKQCNEPYELLLSDLLGLFNVQSKHGWDAYDTEETPTECYEYKPTISNPPCATINDDSEEKIKKYESLNEEGKSGWVILTSINKELCSLDVIYKFPSDIYTEDRKQYLKKLMEKNRNKEKQTRSTYPISVKKSIDLCKKYNKEYHVWKR